MKTFTFKQIILIVITFLCVFGVFAQNDDIKVETPNLSSEGIPNLSRSLVVELVDAFKRKASSFVTFKKDGSVVGYSDDYSPFILSPSGKREDFKIYLKAPEDLLLNPGSGDTFLFTSDSDGNENEQLYEYNFATRTRTQLTNERVITNVSSVIWSGTGDVIYLINSDAKLNSDQIYKLDPTTKELTKLIELKGATHYLSDSNAGKVVYYNYLSNTHTDYYLLDLNTLKTEQLTNESASFRQARFSQVNNGIYWLSDKEGKFNNLYYFDLKTKKEKKVNHPELNINSFELSPDEKSIAFKINESGAEMLRLFQLAAHQITKELPKPEINAGVIERYGWKSNDELGFTFESHKIPPEIKTYNLSNSKLTTFVKGEANQNLIDNLDDPQVIKWKSFDNREISGLMQKPKNAAKQKMPVIIYIHGGPKLQYQPYFSVYKTFPTAHLNAVTIMPNVRGSSGFGREFELADNGDKREDALKDLDALLDWIKTQPDLDAKRIVLKGDSFGAFMALATALRNPDQIKAIIAESPVISLLNTFKYSSNNIQDALVSEYGSDAVMQRLEKLSPISQDNLGKWKTPVFLSIGQNDTRVPLSDVQLFKDKLKAAGVPVWFLKAKNEGHFWSTYDNKIFLNLSEILFLKQQGGF